MEEKIKITPQDVFFHLLALITLIITVVSFIALLFQYVNVLFPDQLKNYYSYTRGYGIMRTAISSLVVVWPVYILISWLIRKQEKKEPIRMKLSFKKWLIYLILFVASLTIIIDLITLVNNFLSGDLTTQFFSKILVVGLVAGVVFGFYVWELKKNDLKSVLPKVLAVVLSIIIFGSIIAGFFIIGTPQEQRARRFDEQRINDLQSIQWQIINYWQKKGKLPKKLSDLNNNIDGYFVPQDPLNKSDYIYNVKGELVFELCAEFQKESDDGNGFSEVYKPYAPGHQENWYHQVGQKCFKRTIDPDLYKSGEVRMIPQ